MKLFKRYLPYFLIAILFILALVIWYFVNTHSYDENYLKVAFLDVGQGDAIYIEAPNGRQILIDGGVGSIILPRLIQVMPFADRSIDIIIVTNPDQDHIGGLVEVLDNYKIGQVIESGTKNDSVIYQKFDKKINENEIDRKIAFRGMKIILDDSQNIYFDILFPDRDVANWDQNEGSIVGRLIYGDVSFMLMGDATKYTENLIKWNENPKTLKSDILKLGHHGSKTSSSLLWLEYVKPKIAIISAGKNNRYGHPHKEILDRLKNLYIKYLITYEKGNIILKTDGVNLFYQ